MLSKNTFILAIKSKTLSVLLTFSVLFLLPLIVANWYIRQITINEFAPAEGFMNTALVTPTLPSIPLNAGSSTPLASFNSDPKFLNFNQMTGYLSLFNINPSLIRYNFYVTNQFKSQIVYKEIGSNQSQFTSFPSVLICGENDIRFGSSTLMRGNLQLNDPSGSDRVYVDGIYNQCATHSNVAFQNILGRSVGFLGMNIQPGSGVRILIAPQAFSDVIISLTFITIWIGFLTLIIGGSQSFYTFLRTLLGKQ